MSWLAAVAATVAWGLAFRPRPSVATTRTGRIGWVVAAVVAGAVAGGLAGARALVLVGVALLAGAGGHVLWRARSRRLAAAAVAARVLETCELLASELAGGHPPSTALARAAEEWPPLAPAARAGALGSDVADSLRSLARLPGAGDLRLLAAAWQVAHRTGHGLSGAVAVVAADVRAAQATRRVVASELASARATARLVALLPLPVLAMGAGAGGDPWAFLVATPAGVACLAGGLALGWAGLWWIEAIAAAVEAER